MGFDYDKYLRTERMPHIWCPGCGHGIIMKAFIRAAAGVGLDPNNVVVVSGIGCASRMPGYLHFDTLHTTHGRALAFATGVKMANPKLHVVVISGDGDAIAIGGNHFIHACRRNIGITMIVANNSIYGMTGGQWSPTQPLGEISSTTSYGNPDPPFDISQVAMACGATFVGRSTVFHALEMERLIKQGLEHKGFSVIEAIGPCYTAHGRRNKAKYKSNIDMIRKEKEMAISVNAAKSLSPDELKNRITTGVLKNIDIPEYSDIYSGVINKAASKKK